MVSLSRLSQFGYSFQSKVIGRLLTNQKFLVNVSDSLTSEFWENSAHKWLIDIIISYYKKYHTFPSIDKMNIEIKKVENEILRISITEELRESYRLMEVSNDLPWVEEEFQDFCTNQQMKKAIETSVDLLNIGDYDGIKTLINEAMKAGQDKNVGHIYEKDIETRYRDDDRSPIPWPWPVFTDMTQGGMGKGDFIILYGNPGGGKTWSAIDIGAHALKLGYNVVHYTLELSEGYVGKRYDSSLTGIPVDKLNKHKQEVENVVSKLKGKLRIKEYPPKRASLGTIENHLEQLEYQEGFIAELVIIDYIDLCKTKSRKENKEEVDDIYIDAKGLAKAKEIPVISPSQANRSGADEDILEGKHSAGSYNKIMIGDMVLSLARTRKDKINGTGKWHWIKNRYGPDGLTFSSKINLSNGEIIIYDNPLDEEFIYTKKTNTDHLGIDDDEKKFLKSKYFND